MARPDSRGLLASIRCPLLVACGDSDALTPLECSQEIAAAVPGSVLEVLPECGHLLTWERPEVVGSLLRQWLERVPA
jgi:pimeloyl-ACP methyl ester carboxylesterase